MQAVDYSQELDAVFAHLESSGDGLGAEEAADRLSRFGANEIRFRKTPAWRRMLAQFRDPMVIILLLTATITTVLTFMGEPMLPDTLVIVGVVLMNALLGFVQEGKAEGALDALRSMLVQECLVIRSGAEHRLPARELVPGDVVSLEAGDKIPADVRFIRVSNLHVDESSLTGESVPVQKITGGLTGSGLVPGDRINTGFSGTYISQGTATAVVVATGNQTEFGQIARMVTSAHSKITPLQHKLNQFVRSLIIAILLVGAASFFYTLYLGFGVSYGFLGAVSLVVASIPEMLPALMTSVLALSGVVMARRKALIRHLPAAETLGATTVICSDKTGTLTENRMTVTRVFGGGQVYDVSTGTSPLEGDFILGTPVEVASQPALSALLAAGSYCNNAHLSGNGGTGDPTEIALRQSGHKGGVPLEQIRRIEEIPFDSGTKYMAVLVDSDQGRQIWVKGAPEVVLGMCHQTLDAQGQPVSLDTAAVTDQASSFASNALRTLGFAMKSVPADHADLRHEDLADLVFVGLQGMIDPPRAAAIDAVATCKQAGIRTVMITGDHPDTARAVAQLLGIDAERAVTGAELTGMAEAELRELVERVSVFARVAPEHKKAIAQALQANQHVVAMTGDGVNDAPALKAADIGIAMGQSGTEVAREAADMVLQDDNFATIVAAVEEGRHAWNNIQKAILYTLPTNAAQALLILGAVLLAAQVPLFGVRYVLEPVQILWINLLDSVLLTMPLVMERKEPDLLKAPPRAVDEGIINARFIQRLLVMGLAISVPGFALYYYFGAPAVVDGQLIDALLLTQAQTAAFWGILLAHIGYAVSARSLNQSAFRFSPFSNPWLLGGIAVSIGIRLIPTALPAANDLFRTAPFPVAWWPYILTCFLPSFIAIEVLKVWQRRRR
jgi:calcium-translocating P-type ATPase